MDFMKEYEKWLASPAVAAADRAELEAITDPKELEDRFYRDLEFGTGGLRGVLGMGTNRMNIYTVRKATQGLADYLNASFSSPSVAMSTEMMVPARGLKISFSIFMAYRIISC